jgi:hypothetical protein
MAEYRPRTETGGSLIGICPDCDGLIYRATTVAKLDGIRGQLDVTMPMAEQPLNDSSEALSNVVSNVD